MARSVEIGGGSAAPRFELRDYVHRGRHTLVLSGELDIEYAAELEATITRVCVGGMPALVIDLSRLTFMDSTGVRAVAAAHRRCQQQGCEFLIVPGSDAVQRVFEISGLLDVLPFKPIPGEESRPRPRLSRRATRSAP